MTETIAAALIGLVAAALGGVIAGCFSLLLQHAKHKDEKEDRAEESRSEWEAHVDECLDRDQKAIRDLQRAAEDTESQGKLTLRCLMAILGHLEDGNHTGELKARRSDIEKYLIERN